MQKSFNSEKVSFGGKILLTDTTRWACAARLAMGFSRAGLPVEVVCPDRHPIGKTRERFKEYRYRAIDAEDSLKSAIEASRPDLVIPCDDRSAHHLRALHGRAAGASPDPWLAALIERSLGLPRSFPIVSARYDLLSLARELGLLIPDTRPINNLEDLKDWAGHHSFPIVLKADGTWGGGGVRVVHTLQEAGEAFLELRQTYNLRRVLTRLSINRDPFWVQPWWSGIQPAVIAQSHVEGQPANCGVFSWQGEVLACITVEAVSTVYANGPASVVRVIDNREITVAAETIARRLGLSGFFGLDFVIDQESGAAYLIEMNPRCTPVCHLQLGPGRDPIEAVRARVSGTPIRDGAPRTEKSMIAYFPQAWRSQNEPPAESFLDIPGEEPDLVHELMRPWPERSLLVRLNNYVKRTGPNVVATFGGKSSGYSSS